MIEYMGITMHLSQEAAAMDKRKLLRSGFLVWIVMTAVFLGLYHPFLFSGRMYAYTDVGADTVDQYLPVMVYETNRLREGILQGAADLLRKHFIEIAPGNTGPVGRLHRAGAGTGNTI